MNPECFSDAGEDPLYRFYDHFWRFCYREFAWQSIFILCWPQAAKVEVFLANVVACGYTHSEEVSFLIYWENTRIRERIRESVASLSRHDVTVSDVLPTPVQIQQDNTIFITNSMRDSADGSYFELSIQTAHDIVTATCLLPYTEQERFLEWACTEWRALYQKDGLLGWILADSKCDVMAFSPHLQAHVRNRLSLEYFKEVAMENHITLMRWILTIYKPLFPEPGIVHFLSNLAWRGQLQMCNTIWPDYELRMDNVFSGSREIEPMAKAIRRANAVRLSVRCWMWCWRWIRGVNRDVATLIGKRMLAQQYD